ncbi:MAG: hypothetical protein AAF525_17515 [Pseudomonadota bacterium]
MDAVKILYVKSARVILGLFVMGYAFQAQALVVDIDITSTAAAEIPSEADGDSDTMLSASPTDTVQAFAEVGLGGEQEIGGESAFANSRGNGAGSFGARANGSGTYSATATFEQAYTITNDDPFAQALSFLFDIENGSIFANCGFLSEGGDACTGTDFAQADYAASIILNGTEIWSSEASVLQNAAGSSFTHDGTALNILPPPDSNSYAWAPQSFLLDLGTIEVADEWNLLYSVTLSVLGQTAGLGGCSYYYEYGNCAMSAAQFGDPSGLSSTGGTMISSAAPPVPVPAPFLLVAGGLAAIAALRRRRERT